MALLGKLEKVTMDKNRVHVEIDGTYSIFQEAGETYLQIDTYGSRSRKIPGKKSQTLQFGPQGLRILRNILSTL